LEESYFYAQTDENGVCYAVSRLTGPADTPGLIMTDGYNLNLLGGKYYNGEWVSED
jgi:hypothetical protein